jgi:hypothetical protein
METDWCYGELGVYSFVIELPPITFEEGGFRLPENQIIPTCEENLPVALYLISYAAADNGIENLTTDQTYSNIQLAINDANDGDEIVVNPGIYHESISFIDKNLTLRSKDPNDPNVVAVTVINIEDQYQGPVITISGSKNGGCLLYGLKITGGQVGISCCDASPTIKNCFIESNGSNAIEFWEFFEPPAIIDSNIIGQVAEVYHPALIAYWKLDEEQGIIAYDSAADCNGTLIGDPVWQPDGGMVDGALQFDGIDDHVITNYVLDPADGPFSVFAWVKGGAPGQIIISQADVTGSSVTWLGLDALGGKLMTDLRPPGSRSPKPPLVSEFVVTDGAWYHVGFVWDGSYRSLYVDDVEVAKDEAALDPLKSATDNLYFGTCKTPDAGTFFSGLIDDVRIYRFYNVALSSE